MDAKDGRKQTGNAAEAAAARYLQGRGVRIIDRNVFSRGGEIDLIGLDQDVLVFFEVRFRGQGSLSSGAESIGHRKQQRLIRAASFYIHRHNLWQRDARIDVVSMAPGTLKKYRIQWIKNAIQAEP